MSNSNRSLDIQVAGQLWLLSYFLIEVSILLIVLIKNISSIISLQIDPHCERKTTRARLSRVRGLMVVQSCQSLGQPGRKHWVEYACQSVLSDLRNLTLLTHQGSPGRVWSCLRDRSSPTWPFPLGLENMCCQVESLSKFSGVAFSNWT